MAQCHIYVLQFSMLISPAPHYELFISPHIPYLSISIFLFSKQNVILLMIVDLKNYKPSN